MSPHIRRILLLAAAVLASCTPSPQDEIDRNERRWLDQSISSYQIEVLNVRSIWHAQTYVITVTNGQVSDATTSCIPAPFEGDSCHVDSFEPEDFTIPGLFTLARSQLDGTEAKYVTIRFSEQFGYPEQIAFDDPNMLDDDVSWAVRTFEPQP